MNLSYTDAEAMSFWLTHARDVYHYYSTIGVEGYKELIKYSEENYPNLGHNGYLEATRKFIIRRVNKNLNLTDEQKAKITSEISNSRLI